MMKYEVTLTIDSPLTKRELEKLIDSRLEGLEDCQQSKQMVVGALNYDPSTSN